MAVYTIPIGLGKPVTYRTFSWLEMAERAWGAEFRQPDHGIYQFSDGRRFDSTDMYRTGIYGGGIVTSVIFDSNSNAITDSDGNQVTSS